ncbi:MAG TPA: 16S rRNA (adenine(1518)-N(6)/adenine(1519)-N(6))-dimethyltransferase RsmA [Candidatus Paceibacterota bacterium]|nr:16S rRNA (adenine(1518)-N(6)/adenine(1519)-N(6))-dimethyltransferase RsmA [Candidatus Paceibacterota bacterium]
MRAKKHLGQHFLKSEKALVQIRDASEVNAEDIILEIGPGLGVLTADLILFAGKVVAIEKDRELIPQLEEKFKVAIEKNRLEILEEDVLDFDPNVMGFYKDFTYKVVANIPYYITGAILEKFLSAQTQPESMTLLIQKEVAERIVARDRKPLGSAQGKESILSLSVKAYGKPRIIAKVPAGAFTPPPKVDSAILHIDDISRDFFTDVDERLFFNLIKATFAGKRKQIGGTLSKFLGDKERALLVLKKAKIASTTRPEALALPSWKRLAQAIKNAKESVQ